MHLFAGMIVLDQSGHFGMRPMTPVLSIDLLPKADQKQIKQALLEKFSHFAEDNGTLKASAFKDMLLR